MLLYVYVSMDPRGLIQINDDDDDDDNVTYLRKLRGYVRPSNSFRVQSITHTLAVAAINLRTTQSKNTIDPKI